MSSIMDLAAILGIIELALIFFWELVKRIYPESTNLYIYFAISIGVAAMQFAFARIMTQAKRIGLKDDDLEE